MTSRLREWFKEEVREGEFVFDAKEMPTSENYNENTTKGVVCRNYDSAICHSLGWSTGKPDPASSHFF
ncbi:hypothetical protein TNCV_3323481 [Trichonephila clavipes]|nr:hypothetical protein TNCV_3323481 [Trichonephila clavipes]